MGGKGFGVASVGRGKPKSIKKGVGPSKRNGLEVIV